MSGRCCVIMECFRQAGVVGTVLVLGGVPAAGLEDYRRDFRAFGLRLNTPIEPWALGVWTRRNVTLSRSAAAFSGVLKRFVEESANWSGATVRARPDCEGKGCGTRAFRAQGVGVVPNGIFPGMAPVFDGGG
jgi:hypothetical protein